MDKLYVCLKRLRKTNINVWRLRLAKAQDRAWEILRDVDVNCKETMKRKYLNFMKNHKKMIEISEKYINKYYS